MPSSGLARASTSTGLSFHTKLGEVSVLELGQVAMVNGDPEAHQGTKDNLQARFPLMAPKPRSMHRLDDRITTSHALGTWLSQSPTH